MISCSYTLFEAPFWDSLLQRSLGIPDVGSYVEALITCASIGSMFVVYPAVLADRYPPVYVAWAGAAMVFIGYLPMAVGAVSIQQDSPEFIVLLCVCVYSWGAGWIYAAAFVTALSVIDPKISCRVMGVMLCGFFFASAWYTEVTLYCCVGETGFNLAAWRHMPIAITALVCGPGLRCIDSGGRYA